MDKKDCVRGIAKHMIKKYSFGFQDTCSKTMQDGDPDCKAFSEVSWAQVYDEIGRMSPQKLGQISSQGLAFKGNDEARTSLYQAFGDVELERVHGGMTLLRKIATATIVASIFDIPVTGSEITGIYDDWGYKTRIF